MGDPKRLGDLGDRPTGLNQVQHLAAELRRIPASSMLGSYRLSSTESNNRTPPNRGKTSHGGHKARGLDGAGGLQVGGQRTTPGGSLALATGQGAAAALDEEALVLTIE